MDKSRLSILLVSQPTEAGVANVVLSHVRHFIGLGWDVHVACPAQKGFLAEKASAAGATTHPWESVRDPGLGVPAEWRSLRRIMIAVQPDLVHLHSAKAGLVGRLAASRKVPILFQPHAWSFQATNGFVRLAASVWERIASRRTDLTLCVSADEQRLGSRYNCLGKTTEIVKNGIDLNHFFPRSRTIARSELGLDPDALIAVCVGRLARQKGQDTLLAVWPAVLEEFPEASLILVGDGPSRNFLLGMQTPRVIFPGAQSDVRPWLAAADLVILPSRWEAGSLTLAEAMAMARAVVATDIEGVREMLKNSEALARAEHATDLVALIKTRLGSKDLREGEAARNLAVARQDLDVTISCRKTAALIERTFQLHSRRSHSGRKRLVFAGRKV